MSLSSSPAVPLGFRFYPTEEELIGFYLQNKLDSTRDDMDFAIPVVDVYFFNPWQLPPMSGEPCRRDGEQWFFFCPRKEREAQGGRPTRTTPTGYWKATGSPSLVFSSSTNRALGVKRTMVFYQGRAPTGTKTKWKMNEYRALAADASASAINSISSTTLKLRGEFSLCRMYTRSGCIRAFDRRPFAAAAAAAADGGIRQRMIPAPEPRAAPSSSEPAAAASAKRCLSHESSSSDGSGSRPPVRRRGEEDDRGRWIAGEDGQCDPTDDGDWFWNL